MKQPLPPFPLPDEKMIAGCLKAAKARCLAARKRSTSGDLTGLSLNAAKEEFKKLYRSARKLARTTALKADHLHEMEALYLVLWPEIDRQVREATLSIATKQKAKEITQLTAEACITESMKRSGLTECEVICQCYRAKVRVYSPATRYYITFMVKYKDIQAGRLDEFITEFLKFNQTLTALPFEVKVCR